MAPAPQDIGVQEKPTGGFKKPPVGEEVVISGISGLFPSSNNTTEFMENLYNNVDMVVENDLDFHHPESPRHVGKIDGVNKFDSQFFKILYYQAVTMDPMNRKLLEQAYMAIYDAGINPLSLSGMKVGVFIGASYSEIANIAMYHDSKYKGNILSGCAKSMFSNRISYWLNAKGPSYTIDCASASSMICLDHAYNAMTLGECDAAIVGGSNLCQLAHVGMNLRRANMASLDGKTKCFDKNGEGYVRAESICCLFLQKAKDAKRIYAELYHIETMYGLYEDAKFLPLQKSKDIEKFLNGFYAKLDVSPNNVDYIEANGAAIPKCDESELKAITNIFAKNRNSPVRVGSVKSNMGDSEPAAGVCALAKVCLAYYKGQLPANLHYKEPIDVPALKEGKLKVVDKKEDFSRGFTAINQFAFNGNNCHALLKGRYKPKDVSKYKCDIPRLVVVSGRQEDAVSKILNILENQPLDPEVVGMLHNIYQMETPGHMQRGYIILDKHKNNKTETMAKNAKFYSGVRRPLALVFSGMGSQWPGMAKELMRLPTFARSIKRCHKILEPFGVDLIRVLTANDKTTFDNILNCFIGITATQIGLTDVLKEIGVNPDYIIGHSQGEMACAYWDNCFTADETILAAYSRGKVSLDTKFIDGSMAAVGLGYKNVVNMCPPEIDVACHNSNESATLSGPADVIKNFVAELSAKGIFAREVPSAHIAFHSRYIQHAGPVFLQKMESIIKASKPRSEKWICTSIPENRWDEDLAKYSSAQYHTNNLMSPVYFEEASQHIPSNAVVVEVAPHGLLQAILKRSHPDCTHIPITNRGNENPIKFFLEGIGKLYEEGFNFKIDALYPKIEYPVSTETQMISHFVEWEHSEKWPNMVNDRKKRVNYIGREFIMSVHDDEFKFVTGHIRDGVNIFPESAILFLVWETLALYMGIDYKDLSVVLSDIHFYGEAIVPKEDTFKLNLLLSKGNDYFEVTQGEVLLTSGYIAKVVKPKFDFLKEVENNDDNVVENVRLKSYDIYKYLHARGITYRNQLQSISSTNFKRNEAYIKETENWIILIDSLFQLNILANEYKGVSTPKIVKKLTISVDDHRKASFATIDNKKCYKAQHYDIYKITRCGGIELRNVILEERPIKEKEPDILQSLEFIPNIITDEMDVENALQIIMQTVADNMQTETIVITEVRSEKSIRLSKLIEHAAGNIPDITIELRSANVDQVKDDLLDSNLVILSGTITREVFNNINEDALVLIFGQNFQDFKHLLTITVLSSINVQGKDLILLRMKKEETLNKTKYIRIEDNENLSWVSNVDKALHNLHRVILVSEKQPCNGIYGLVKHLKKSYPTQIGLVIIDDHTAPPFDDHKSIYRDQLEKNMTFNIFQEGKWGSYYYLPNSPTTDNQNYKLFSSFPGSIDSLKWMEATTTQHINNTVQVHYAGVSLKDVHKATGISCNNAEGFGFEFSGYDSKERRVMGLINGNTISSTVEPNLDLLWPVPDHWSLEEAATVPLAYATAVYCLAIKGQIRRKQTIFVSGGAGALGQAIISLCLSIDVDVYTSVSDKEKKEFLLKLFPKLKEDHIGNTRNGDFQTMVLTNTKGKGCDFVVNCATGYAREAAIKCTKSFGLFLDLNELDWKTNKPIGMSILNGDKNFRSVMLSSIFKPENARERKMIQWTIVQGITNGAVRPLSRLVFPPTEVTRAFRLLSLNKNRGRVLMRIRNSDNTTNCMKVASRLSYSVKGSYVLICDESELGIEIANQLVTRGARKLILNLKSKNLSGLMHLKSKYWNELGANVKISTENLDLEQNCSIFLNESQQLGPVQGIFVILGPTPAKDRLCHIDFTNKCKNSSKIVSNLDVISRNNIPDLSNFVVILRKSRNPTDEYVNSICENICHTRVKAGLPATSLRIELLDELEPVDSSNDKLSPQNAMTLFNALETCIRTKKSRSITYNFKKENHIDFFGKIATYLGLQNLDEIDQELKIKDFIVNDSGLEEIKNLIKVECSIDYKLENLKDLSIERLKSLHKQETRQNTKLNSNLGAFYSFIDHEEHVAALPMISMKTVLNRNFQTNELNENATHLLLIPGFEGHHHVFNKICERLTVRAVTFQLAPDNINNIPAMAKDIFEMIKKTFVFKSKFYLMGYSFGVNVALEVAAILEKEGHIGVVYCLDSSPDALRVQLNAHVGEKTDTQLQNSIIEHLFYIMTGEKSKELSKAIDKLDNWPEKVETCVAKLKQLSTYSIQYMKDVLESAYHRLKLAQDFSPNLRLESELVLLKGVPHPKSGNLDSDYGLSKFTKKPVKVFEIPSDHANVHQDCRVSNIVNKLIDPKLLENFMSNVCQSYLEG